MTHGLIRRYEMLVLELAGAVILSAAACDTSSGVGGPDAQGGPDGGSTMAPDTGITGAPPRSWAGVYDSDGVWDL